MTDFEISTNDFDPTQLRAQAKKPAQQPAAEPAATASAEGTPSQSQQRTAESRTQKSETATHTTANSTTSSGNDVEDGADDRTYPLISAFFTDGRLLKLFGVFLMLLATYMLIASISYLTSGNADQSILLNSSADEIAQQHDRIENATGWVGSTLSYLVMYKWLGIGAFVIIFYLAALGLTFVGLRKFNVLSLTFKSLVTAIAISIIIGLISYHPISPMLWGGVHGHEINRLLIDNASIWSAIGVSLFLLAALVLIFIDPISKMWHGIANRWTRYRQYLAERHEAALRAAAEAEQQARQQAEADVSDPIDTGQDTTEERPDANEMHHASAEEERPEMHRVLTDIEDAPLSQYKATTSETQSEHDEPSEHESDAEANDDTDVTDEVAENRDTMVDNGVTDLTEIPTVTDSEIDVIDGTDVVEDADNTDGTDGTKDAEEVTEDGSMPTLEVDQKPIEVAEEIITDAYDPTAELSHYRFPTIDLLKQYDSAGPTIDEVEQEANKQQIIHTLRSYGVEIDSIKATVGPTITLYEMVPAEGVRIAKIRRLADDLTLSLQAIGIRLIAPMPGRGTIGMEVPNRKAQVVSIRSILSSKAYQESKAELPMAMGTTISNEVYIADLAKMPHLLVAGATGMGKSVGLNTIIASLLYKKHPAELKFVLVDPKMVEFSLYGCIEHHFLAKLPDEEKAIITDMSKVVPTLNSLCIEMDNRYALLAKAGKRSIKEYNSEFIARRLNPEKGHRYLPYIVVIVDEFADLIMTSGKEVETPIARIAQKARAVGIHMILATQRPSVNVITGIIKANFPGRVAFRVTQGVDSKTILDRPGAEQLVGRGDMLFSRDGMIDRVQCALIETSEVNAICNYISEQIGYPNAYELPDYVPPTEGGGAQGNLTDRDPLFADAGRLILESGVGSTSLIQRKYSIGYPRAAKIMDQLEIAGVVGAAQGGKPRPVLMDIVAFERTLGNE